jgi:hypothetical protein
MKILRKMRVMTWVVIATLLSFSLVAPASAAPQGGAPLTVNGGGQVRVDGVTAVTGATVFSGSRVSTPAGTTASITSGGSRVTINSETDAIVTYAGGYMRADVICGSASGVPAAGQTFELITHGDTSLYVQAGTIRVMAEGKTTDLITNQTQTFTGGVHVMASGAAAFDATTILCSCMCAAPAAFPVVAAGSSLALLLLLLGGAAAAAVAVPVALSGDETTVVTSPTQP